MVTKAKNSTLEATLSVVNVGTGMDVLVNEAPSQQSVWAKSIKAGTNVTITDDGSTLTINSTASGGTGGITGATNAGTGAGVASGVSGTSLVLKSLKAGPNIAITSTADEITVEATGSASGEANTASNVGTGVGVFKSKTGVDLAFKSLKAGSNITITPSADELLIESSGLGSGTSPVKSIEDFGAVGDGATDNTAAFQAAATWIQNNSKPVFIPAGTYLTGAFILYSAANQEWCGFYGEDPKRTIIQSFGTTPANTALVTVGSSSMSTYVGYMRFANITFKANGVNPGATAFRTYDLAWSEFENCAFQGGSIGFDCLGGVNITFSNCFFQYSGIGLKISSFSRTGGGWPNNIKVRGGAATDNSSWGYYFDNGRQLIIDGAQIENNGTTKGLSQGGIYAGASIGDETGQGANLSLGVHISGCWLEANKGKADIYFADGINNVTGCLFWSLSSYLTNQIYADGGKYNLLSCDFGGPTGQGFTAAAPNIYESASVQAGNTIIACEFVYATWSTAKTTLVGPATTYVPALSAAGDITTGGRIYMGDSALEPPGVFNSMLSTKQAKPRLLFGYAGGTSMETYVPLNTTSPTDGYSLVITPVHAALTSPPAVYIRSQTTTGFTVYCGVPPSSPVSFFWMAVVSTP